MLYLQGFPPFGVLAAAPFLRHFRMDLHWVISTCAAELELLDRLLRRFIGRTDIPIHWGFDAHMPRQFLQSFQRHSAFNRTGCISVAQRVHTKAAAPRFIAKLMEVGTIYHLV